MREPTYETMIRRVSTEQVGHWHRGRILYVVGQHRGQTWEFVGVFSTEPLAIAACTGPLHFVAPCTLDQPAPDESTSWPGAFYPDGEERKSR